jgi:hypothetical protein
MTPSEIFSLRMELSAAGIVLRACCPNGDYVEVVTVSETGIRALLYDFPEAVDTGIFVGDSLIPVASIGAAKAVLAQAERDKKPPLPAAEEPKYTGRGGNRKTSKLEPVHKAQSFLVSYLARGVRRAADVRQRAKEQGIPLRALRAAAQALGVIIERVRRAEDQRTECWTWRLEGVVGELLPPDHDQMGRPMPQKDRGRNNSSSSSETGVRGFGRPLYYRRERF